MTLKKNTKFSGGWILLSRAEYGLGFGVLAPYGLKPRGGAGRFLTLKTPLESNRKTLDYEIKNLTS